MKIIESTFEKYHISEEDQQNITYKVEQAIKNAYEEVNSVKISFTDGKKFAHIKINYTDGSSSSLIRVVWSDEDKPFIENNGRNIELDDLAEIRKVVFASKKHSIENRMSFYNGTLNKEVAKKLIRTTDKPCLYTRGFAVNSAETYLEPISKDNAINIIDNEKYVEINEYNDYIDVHVYDENDLI